jgi:catechol 2,3-dioxygenase-like lactoylglutathione lyase family enzyme
MIKVKDVAYVRFGAPDLGKMKTFLEDFGMLVTAETDEVLYVRGTDGSPYVHITEKGEAGFRSVAFEAGSEDDLRAAAELEGASAIEKIDAPGGGQRVCFSDPDGHRIEVVHGRELLETLPVRSAEPLNTGSKRTRFGTLQRVEAGPASVKRIGHVVLKVSDYGVSSEWFQSRFGFVSSDDVYLGDESNLVVSFLRCDLGETYSDHHSLLCIGLGDTGFDHAAFEVEDWDSLMVGHEQLEKGGYAHHAGIGRHVLGSQVYDYWKDPWGNVLEHFTDGDLLNSSHKTGLYDPGVALGTQWGTFGPPS